MGGKPKKEDMNVPPPPSPTPIPTPSEISPMTAERKRARTAAMRFGLMSTMKSGPGGVTGAGPDLLVPAAGGRKKTLGE